MALLQGVRQAGESDSVEQPVASGAPLASNRSARTDGWAALSLGVPKKAYRRRDREKADYPKDHLSRATFELEAKALEFHRPSRVAKGHDYEGSQKRGERQPDNCGEMPARDLQQCVERKEHEKTSEYRSGCDRNGQDQYPRGYSLWIGVHSSPRCVIVTPNVLALGRRHLRRVPWSAGLGVRFAQCPRQKFDKLQGGLVQTIYLVESFFHCESCIVIVDQPISLVSDL
jgi:hypothetical protein